jgi:hypothetical protein
MQGLVVLYYNRYHTSAIIPQLWSLVPLSAQGPGPLPMGPPMLVQGRSRFQPLCGPAFLVGDGMQ